MDKVKVILKQLKKHHFWILTVIVIIAALVGWMSATNKLSASYLERKSKIIGTFKKLDDVKGTDPHPNSAWKEAVGKLASQQRGTVRAAWEKVYNEQKKSLVWPEELKKDFIDYFEKNPQVAEINNQNREFCERYQNYIKNEVPKLLAIIDAKMSSENKSATGPAGAPATRDDTGREYKVALNDASQHDMMQDLEWSTSTPTPPEIRLAQENLWVYQTLFNIIKKVNDAHGYTPSVRKIDAIAIGKHAVQPMDAGNATGHIEISKSDAAPAAGSAEPPPAAAPTGGEADAGPKAPDEKRYVDAEDKVLAGGTAEKEVLKRLPIYMNLVIDEQDIAKLLVECANSPLPLEIKQVRINAGKGNAPVAGAPGTPGAPAEADETVHRVPVELVGVMVIYNRPDAAVLGEQPAAGDAPPAEAPAGG